MKKHYDSVDLVDCFKSLIGQKIISVSENVHLNIFSDTPNYVLTTDKGIKLIISINEGCGGCENGWSSFLIPSDLVDCNNAIVDISIADGNFTSNDDQIYILSIFKENKQISQILTNDGYGNGYYGGGFQIEIKGILEEDDE